MLSSYARTQGESSLEAKRNWNRTTAAMRGALRKEIIAGMFSTELRDWRGERLQKEAADALGVPLGTYVNWERNFHVPSTMALAQVRGLMREHPEKKE